MKIFAGYKQKDKKRYGLVDKGSGFELILSSGKKIYLRERDQDVLEIMSIDGRISVEANASNVFYINIVDRRTISYTKEMNA